MISKEAIEHAVLINNYIKRRWKNECPCRYVARIEGLSELQRELLQRIIKQINEK